MAKESFGLTCVRWFYSENGSFVPFGSYDTIQIEKAFRSSLERVIVRNGMFVVEMDNRTCSSIYDSESKINVVRGTWFYSPSNIPVPEWLARELEEQNDTIISQNLQLPYILELEEYLVMWNGNVIISTKSPTLVNSLMHKIGLSDPSSTVVRGYYKRANPNKTARRVDHVVFIVPGIAQSLDKTNASLCCQRLGRTIRKECQNIELIPINWRSIELGERTLEAIMPQANTRIRDFLHNSLLDVLYYSSPHFRNKIISKLAYELRRLYSLFLRYHQDNKPKISVVAHSLGSVIFYDLITGQRTCVDYKDDPPVSFDLEITNLFMIGSPLAVFLMLRGFNVREFSTIKDILPNYNGLRLFNVFFPSDFMAYRIEPMFWKEFRHVAPIRMDKLFGSVDSQDISVFESIDEEEIPWYRRWNLLSSFEVISSVFGDSNDPNENAPTLPGLGYRIDYALTENSLYIFRLLTSHFAYWDNSEFVSFIVKCTAESDI